MQKCIASCTCKNINLQRYRWSKSPQGTFEATFPILLYFCMEMLYAYINLASLTHSLSHTPTQLCDYSRAVNLKSDPRRNTCMYWCVYNRYCIYPYPYEYAVCVCVCVFSELCSWQQRSGCEQYSFTSERRRRRPQLNKDSPSASLQTAANPLCLSNATRFCSLVTAQ